MGIRQLPTTRYSCYNKFMEDFAVGYLFYRFFYRIIDFFRHWYVGGSRVIAHGFMITLEHLDQSFAVKITLLHFFEPLYKDYSAIGRVLGIIFRTFRVLIGAVIYLLITICFAIGYLAWISVPPVLLFLIVREI